MSLNQSLFKSSFLLFVGRFLDRAIGLVSTLILARVLLPEDFGIVAIASIVVFFFDSISNVGIREYLTQKSNLTDDDINSAWTFNGLTKLLVWGVFVLSSSFIADFYDKPELFYVFLVISLIVPLMGFENVGLILSQRELDYDSLFKLRLTEKITAFVVMLCLLSFMQSYWVMILSMVFSYFVRFFGSYYIDPYRPTFCLKNIGEQWHFSKWLLPKGVIGFIKSEVDTLMVSKFFGLAALGGFNLVKSLISMVGRDIVQPATEPLLAAFSKSKEESDKLGFQVLMSFWVICLFVLPIVGYCFYFGNVVVGVLYGDQWLEYANVLQALSPLIIVFATTGVFWNFLTSQGKVRELFYFEILAMFTTIILLASLALSSLDEFATVRVLISFVFWLAMLIYVRSIVNFSVIRLLRLTFPLIAGVYVAHALASSIPLPLDVNVIVELLVTGSAFVVIYAAISGILLLASKNTEEVTYLLWFLETNILAKIKHKFL